MSDDINAAINAAADEAVEEVKGTAEPESAPEPTPEPTPEPEAAQSEEPTEEAPAKAEPPAEEETEEENDLALSAEDLKAINDNELLRRAYKSMQRGLTKKTQGIAETRKEFEQAKQMVEYIRANPDKAVEEMAEMRGYVLAKKDTGQAQDREIQETASDAVTQIVEKYSKDLGPESTKLLTPFMKEIAEAVVQQTVAPIAERTKSLDASAKQRAIAAAVHEFGAKVKEQGEDWTDDIQDSMAAMMDQVVPGDHTPLPVYLTALYNAVTAERSRTNAVKAQLSRLRKAQAEAEPTHSVRPKAQEVQQITSDMSEKDAIALATAMAEKEARAL